MHALPQAMSNIYTEDLEEPFLFIVPNPFMTAHSPDYHTHVHTKRVRFRHYQYEASEANQRGPGDTPE